MICASFTGKEKIRSIIMFGFYKKASKIWWNLPVCKLNVKVTRWVCLKNLVFLENLNFTLAVLRVWFWTLKLRHYGKATKFEKNLPPVLTKQLFLLSSVKTSGRFFQFFWPSQKSWTLTVNLFINFDRARNFWFL